MIGIVIAEDEHMIRGALVALLQLEDDIDVLAEVARGDEVMAAIQQHHPDVAVLDIDMPGLDGLTIARLIHDTVPRCQTLVLTGLSQPGHLLTALEAHVRGFLLKAAPASRLADAIRQVAAGQRVLHPDLVATAIETGASPLTPRETDVLRHARNGQTTEQIGADLYLSPTTVRNYLSNAITKIGARNRTDAIRKAEQAGWLWPEPPPR